jgi:hypothetical protein
LKVARRETEKDNPETLRTPRLAELSRKHYISSYGIALIHTGLGQKDQAVTWLEKAYAERSTDMVHLGTDPRFDELRSLPRFRELMVRIGLPS